MTGRQQYNIIRGNRYTPRCWNGPLWATILNLKGETAFEPLGAICDGKHTYIRSVYFYFTVPRRFYARPRRPVGPGDTGTDDYGAGRKIISLRSPRVTTRPTSLKYYTPRTERAFVFAVHERS